MLDGSGASGILQVEPEDGFEGGFMQRCDIYYDGKRTTHHPRQSNHSSGWTVGKGFQVVQGWVLLTGPVYSSIILIHYK